MKASIKYILTSFLVLSALYSQAQNEISLAGTWDFKLDEKNEGLKQNWQLQSFSDKIQLPGTTDEAHFGTKTSGSDFGILTRVYKYVGPAWYQKEIVVPSMWKSKDVVLELERVMWKSTVFLDGKEIASQDALSSPHRYNLGNLKAGKHKLSIRVDNDMIYNIGDKGHVYTEYTQTIWNGIVGEIKIFPKNRIHFNCPRIDTFIKPVGLQISDNLENASRKTLNAKINVTLKDAKTGKLVHQELRNQILKPGKNAVKWDIKPNEIIKLWDDVNPNLYELTVSILNKKQVLDTYKSEIGFREITTSKSKILVNGKPVFFRGNLDCVHFPLTGYPSTKEEDWERIFKIYKDYGFNHVRFHSWCPPKAAFAVADRMGIYIMAETIWIDWWMGVDRKERPEMYTKGLPQGLGKNPSADEYVQKELDRMVINYGNHASLAVMCIGNELGNSHFDVMSTWIEKIKKNDNRRLYSVSTARKIMPVDDIMVTHNINQVGATRGIKGGASLDWDFEDVYSKSDIPIIAHEIGQWPVYPSWEEIEKYTGVLRARNFEEFREMAKKNKIESQNKDFVKASGALNQIMYKYEIESFLRTPSCAGIQLLSMQDYQGQGEALIGWLDAFWDSKGITTAEKFKLHHDSTVALLRIPKFTYKNNEKLEAKIQIAHYGTQALNDQIYWKINDENQKLLGEKTLAEASILPGTSEQKGILEFSFSEIKNAQKLTIQVGLKNHKLKNSWEIWVYPETQNEIESSEILISNRLNGQVLEQLKAGKKVLLEASALGDASSSEAIGFFPLYWSMTFFPGQNRNTLGLIVQNAHPALATFPSESHSNWQWQSIYKSAKTFYINSFPETYRPIVQPVDDFHRNNKLASVFELKVGKGKLLISGFNFNLQDNPVAKQLKTSLIAYMKSDSFAPKYEVDGSGLSKMFKYIEPVKAETPEKFADAAMYIEAGSFADSLAKNWSSGLDKSILKKGYKYKTKAKVEKSAWTGENLEVDFEVSQGISGSLYILLKEGEKNKEDAIFEFEGRDYLVSKGLKDGEWIKLNVMREDSNDGKLLLKSNDKLKISKIVLTEE